MQHSHGPAPIQQHHLLFSRRRNGANCTRAPLPYARSVSVCLSVNPRCHGRHHTGNRSECDQNGLICPTRIAEITMRCQVGQVNNIEFFCPAHQILVLRRGPSGHYQLRPPWMGTAPVVGRKRHYSIMAHHGPCLAQNNGVLTVSCQIPNTIPQHPKLRVTTITCFEDPL